MTPQSLVAHLLNLVCKHFQQESAFSGFGFDAPAFQQENNASAMQFLLNLSLDLKFQLQKASERGEEPNLRLSAMTCPCLEVNRLDPRCLHSQQAVHLV